MLGCAQTKLPQTPVEGRPRGRGRKGTLGLGVPGELKDLRPHSGSLVRNGRERGAGPGVGARGTLASSCTKGGGEQCSQLISSLSGQAQSELISFVEREIMSQSSDP